MLIRDWGRDMDGRLLGTGGKYVIDEVYMIVLCNQQRKGFIQGLPTKQLLSHHHIIPTTLKKINTELTSRQKPNSASPHHTPLFIH